MATEKFTVDGSQVVEKIKELIHQGNIRRVRLIHKGRPLIDIPLTAGVGVAAVTALAAPVRLRWEQLPHWSQNALSKWRRWKIPQRTRSNRRLATVSAFEIYFALWQPSIRGK
jgi:hypothetical protein